MTEPFKSREEMEAAPPGVQENTLMAAMEHNNRLEATIDMLVKKLSDHVGAPHVTGAPEDCTGCKRTVAAFQRKENAG